MNVSCMELRAGIEPAIYSLQVNCLTIRLPKHSYRSSSLIKASVKGS